MNSRLRIEECMYDLSVIIVTLHAPLDHLPVEHCGLSLYHMVVAVET